MFVAAETIMCLTKRALMSNTSCYTKIRETAWHSGKVLDEELGEQGLDPFSAIETW